jgi:hypothetical protein
MLLPAPLLSLCLHHLMPSTQLLSGKEDSLHCYKEDTIRIRNAADLLGAMKYGQMVMMACICTVLHIF